MVDLRIPNYDNFVLLGELNMEVHAPSMKEFCLTNDFSSLIRTSSCLKTELARCINLIILTNKPTCFHSSLTLATGVPDFHKIIVTVVLHLTKVPSREIL